MRFVRRTWVLAASLPFLASCDSWEAQWQARRKCERGLSLITGAEARMQRPTLTLAERRGIRSDLFDGLFLIRSGAESSVPPGFLYHPDKYAGMVKKAGFLMIDPRVAEISPP
jgi:hypothetical protein